MSVHAAPESVRQNGVTQGGVSRARPRPDPRTLVLLVVVVSVAVMSPGGLRFVPAALLLGLLLAVWDRALRRVVLLVLAVVVAWALGWLLPSLWVSPLTATGSLAGTYLIRFVVAVGVGSHVVRVVSPTGLNVALRGWNVPRPIAVTTAVMLRFFPVVAAESAAVLDAMRLRGLAGPVGLLRHPVRSVERFAVPMIAASLRASDDLAAAAVLRGLGSHRRPTAMQPHRFGPPDLALALTAAALTAGSLLLPTVLT